jgi:hypothetical protein
LFLRAEDERFDQYGRRLADIAPSYDRDELACKLCVAPINSGQARSAALQEAAKNTMIEPRGQG